MYFEDYDSSSKTEHRGEDVFSKPVRAGKRTYFFDVKSTKGNDYYLTITESKRRVDKEGRFSYEKHKIFLYKEDFEKFLEGLNEVVDYIKTNQEVIPRSEMVEHEELEMATTEFSSVSFEDLEK